ncbi:AsmA-like C-terminal region-containing protein [uncultured Marivita sp.]|uniref:YhdP family protein n=1 Tax=uncultured Marivita sp. TaxID=888080 RepID=UPI0026240B1D|nr:AsmA-like C-terminal region-containing protein [uncultured Marivita sp.]
MTEPEQSHDISDTPRRRRRGRWALGVTTVLVLSVLVAGWALVGRSLSAPIWVRDTVEERLADALPGFRVLFGDVQVRLEQDGRTRIILLDVDVQTATGAPVAVLSDVQIGLTAYDLIRRQIVLRDLSVSGAFVTLTRNRAGQLGLALGDAFAMDGASPDLPTLVAQVDALLVDDRLSRLQSVEANALTLRFEDARARRGWTVDGGRLLLERENEQLRLSGDFALLGGGATATRLQLDASSVIGETEVAFGVSLDDMPSQDIATQGPALAWLGALRAPISGSLRATMQPDGGLGVLNATLQIDEGVLQPTPETPPVPFNSARSYFTFDPDRSQITFTELSVDSDLVRAVADGRATLDGLRDGIPSEMLGQVRFSLLEAAPDALFEAPLSLDRAELDFRLRLNPFELDLGRVWIDDPQVPLRMTGRLLATEDAWDYALDGTVGVLTPDALLRLWPVTMAPRTRDWVVNNIEGGVITEGQFALRSQDQARPVVFLNAAFDEAQVRYTRTLPVVERGKGTLTLNANRLAVRVTEGEITPQQGGVLDITGSTFVIPDTRQRPPEGQVTLAGGGQIEALLSYLDSPGLEIMQKARRPVDIVSGRARFDGSLILPLRRGLRLPDIQLDVRGRATGVVSDQIIPNRELTARMLDVSVTNEALRISGQAELSGVPFNGSWTLPIPAPGEPATDSMVEGTVTLSEAAARSFGVALPDGTISGIGPAELRVDLRRGAPPEFELTSRLSGIGLSLPAIGWTLARGTTGSLRVAGVLDRPARIDTLALDAPGLEAQGSVRLNADGSLATIDLDRVRAGGWLDAPVTLTGRGAGAATAVRISGGTIDLRNAPFGRGSGGGAGGRVPLSLALDQLQVSNSIRLTDFRGDLQSGAGLTGNFTASVNGKAPIVGEALAQAGSTAFRIRSNDAGKVIREAGILKTVAGGDMTLALVPVPGQPGSYDGSLDVVNTRLRNAPGIASLLDAISIVGLLDQLEGPGILFTEVEARFRLTPDQLYLTRSSATGPSMGISLDGTYNLATSTLDLQGVLSPIFFLNGIGSIFTRKGEGLIGFNFNLTGPASQPNVSVNPLSALTPGMFREIFRRPAPVPGE